VPIFNEREIMKKVLCAALTIVSLTAIPLLSQPLMAPPPAAQADSSQYFADKIIGSPLPVLVDFWASWCGPCRMLTPIVKELEKEYKGKLVVVKVNVDHNRELSNYFQVTGIPAVFLVKNKTVVNYLQGVQPKEAYKAAIEEMLSKPVAKPSSGTAKAGKPAVAPQKVDVPNP
jgi:thioredoxin